MARQKQVTPAMIALIREQYGDRLANELEQRRQTQTRKRALNPSILQTISNWIDKQDENASLGAKGFPIRHVLGRYLAENERARRDFKAWLEYAVANEGETASSRRRRQTEPLSEEQRQQRREALVKARAARGQQRQAV